MQRCGNGKADAIKRGPARGSAKKSEIGQERERRDATDKKDNALLVPNSALLPKGASHVVQVLNTDGTKREVEVQTGLTDGANTEITSGLNAGDKVVTTPITTTTTKRGLFG